MSIVVVVYSKYTKYDSDSSTCHTASRQVRGEMARERSSFARCNTSASASALGQMHAMRSLYMRNTPCLYHVNDQGVFKAI